MKRACAFTLLELLVVVGVVVVLIALVIPVLGKTRETARRAVCASRLRAQGSMASIYAARYNDQLPLFFGNPPQKADKPPDGPPLRPGPTSAKWWWDESSDFVDGLTDHLVLNANGTKSGTTPAKQRQLFFCPSNEEWAATSLADWQVNEYPQSSTSRSLGYGWVNMRGLPPYTLKGYSRQNAQANPLSFTFTEFKKTSAATNTRTPPIRLINNLAGARWSGTSELAFDVIISMYDPPGAFDQLSGYPAGTRSNHLAGRKAAGANILFCDGHVDWRKMPWEGAHPNGIGLPCTPRELDDPFNYPFFWIPNP